MADDIQSVCNRWLDNLLQLRRETSGTRQCSFLEQFKKDTLTIAAECERKAINSSPLLEFYAGMACSSDGTWDGALLSGYSGGRAYRLCFAAVKRAQLRIGLPPLIKHRRLTKSDLATELQCDKKTLDSWIGKAGVEYESGDKLSHETQCRIAQCMADGASRQLAANAHNFLIQIS
jgi:hypothetical protein